MGLSNTNDYNKTLRCQISVQNLLHPVKPEIRTQHTLMFFAPLKSKERAENQNKGVSKTSDNIKSKIKMPNPTQELPESSKTPNQDFKDMEVLCTF